MSTVILCEKPSIAKQISEGLKLLTKSPVKKENGFFSCANYQVTYAFGHLLELDIAADFGSFSQFPVFPKTRTYVPSGDSSAKKQLKVVKSLLQSASEIIIATDPGREGELIARLIINHAKAQKTPYKRFWTSESITANVVLREMKQLRDGRDYDSLYLEALGRQQADCDVGINLSRALATYVGDGQKWSIGRVQTPVVMILAERENDIKNHVPEPYALIKGVFGTSEASYEAKYLPDTSKVDSDTEKNDEANRLSREDAAKLIAKLKTVKTAQITEVSTKKKTELPPLLHTITTFQIAANKKYGMNSMHSSKILQKLYEAGYVSYPRTEAKHLGTGNAQLVIDSLKLLNRADLVPAVDTSNKRIFDNSKLTDHHALIPLKNGSKLTGDDAKAFNIVATAFLAAFYPPAESELFTILTDLDGSLFKASGTQDLKLGWKEVFGYKQKTFSFKLEKGTKVNVLDLKAEDKLTSPPSRYTEATLLKVMENAHLLIPKEQRELRATMKNKENAGLGTGATRAGIINNVKLKGFFTFSGKAIVASEKAVLLYNKLAGKLTVADPIMTAEWEQHLGEIRETTMTIEEFMEKIHRLVEDETKTLKSLSLSEISTVESATCPSCKASQLKMFGAGASCPSCDMKFWKKVLGAKMSDTNFLKYLQGEKIFMKNLKSSKPGAKKFDTWVFFKDGRPQFDFSLPAPVAKKRTSTRRAKSSPKKTTKSRTTSKKTSSSKRLDF